MAASQPHSHVPFGSDGSGYYSDNTIGCYDVVKGGTHMCMEALGSVPFKAGSRSFVIADFGAADGGTSMFLIHNCIKWLKERYGKDQDVHIVYEDQPLNDFKSLFMRIQGLIPGPPSYLDEYSNVYVTASGTSFYSQCMPSNSVHLGFSSTAFHWLSKRPCEMKDAIHHVLSTDTEVNAMFADQAARDWETNLLHRAHELVPGGHMVVLGFCVDREGQYLGKTSRVKENMYDNMAQCWKEMVVEKQISQEEFEAASFNNYYRTEEEYSAPFLDESSPVYEAGLRLVSIESKVVQCPYLAKWLKEGKKDDPEAARKHAQWFIPTTRTWSNYTFLSALSNERTDDEKSAIVDAFYKKYEDRVAAAPEDHGIVYVHSYIHIKKID